MMSANVAPMYFSDKENIGAIKRHILNIRAEVLFCYEYG